MQMVCRETSRRRASFVQQLNDIGISVPDSQTNFVLADLGNVDRAAEVDAVLRNAGIFCGPMTAYGLPAHLRITIGDDNAMRQTAQLLERKQHGEEPK